MSHGYLVLETGEVYAGVWNGGKDRAGEVVFNTSHSGFEEIATDPSYFSQIVVMTAPMQGNYGSSQKVWESRKYWIEGFVCLQMQNSPRENSWLKKLNDFQIPSLSEIDTREIVLRLRNGGTPWGALVQAANEAAAKEKATPLISEKKKLEKDWVYLASRKEVEKKTGQKKNGVSIAVLDFGCKENILRELAAHCEQLIIMPSRSTPEEIQKYKPTALMLTNGPGDPADVQVAVETVQSFLGKLPIFGICMGHQILALALGAKTYKLKFGHRGSNHPIRDELVNEVYISSQNHGYAVDAKTLPSTTRVTHTNLNDQTVAGFFDEKMNCLGIQYHPESHPGPHDAVKLFDFFIGKMIGAKK